MIVFYLPNFFLAIPGTEAAFRKMVEGGQVGMFGGVGRLGKASGPHTRAFRLPEGQRTQQSHSMLRGYVPNSRFCE